MRDTIAVDVIILIIVDAIAIGIGEPRVGTTSELLQQREPIAIRILVDALSALDVDVRLPLHPRTRAALARLGVRTAVAKGVSFRQAVLKHALRNSLIPLATYFGQSVTVLVGGSFLVEFIFDINGMGLLGYTSVVDRDYPTVMGVLLISSLLLLLGHILADVLVALVDPRIRFN